MRLLTIDIEAREIAGHPGYVATRDGWVYGRRGRRLSSWRNSNGYMEVKVGSKHMGVHRAIALAWLENPAGLSDVNHIDGDKDNNQVGNLEWVSRSGNIRHALDTGLHACPETPVFGVHLETGAGVWARSQAAVRALGFQQSLVNKCLKGERRHHRGYQWSYACAC